MTAPAKPIIALTLVLAGKREIPGEALDNLTAALDLVFGAIGDRLAALGPAGPAAPGLAGRFALGQPPRLTLITGLADGADQIAQGRFLARRPDPGVLAQAVGAVLPCERRTFARNSPVADADAFERSAAACDFIIELDERLPPAPRSADATLIAERRRVRRERGDAFEAQAEMLLRNGDILLAVDDPDDDGRAGGTRQTIGRALDQGLPVVLHRLGEPGVSLLRARA